MKISVPSTIGYSREQVFLAYRDDLPQLVEYLPNIEKIDVALREEPQPGIVRFENHWYAEANIPKVAQKFIKPDMLKWIDHATWNEDAWTCDWRIETMFMSEAVSCSGHNTFVERDDGTMDLLIEGDLKVNSIPGMPRLLAGTVAPQIEKFIVSLITPNFDTINKGIASHLAKKLA